MVIGERVWRSRLHADSGIVGRPIRYGATTYTIVGIVPEAFAFPVNYALWVPLKDDLVNAARGDGPMIGVFGRLSDGVSVEQAQAELAAIGLRASEEFPQTNTDVRPQVTQFLDAILADGDDQAAAIILYSVNIFLILFLCVCTANIATLVFARTATREGEIAIRTSLGASRGRIVMQLFCESFALALISGVMGLAATALLLRHIRVIVERALGDAAPFWWSDDLSSRTVWYALLLTVIAAIVVGVVPALKATSHDVGTRLKQAASGNSSLRFGRLWTGVIVSQVALTVLFLMTVTAVFMNLKVGRYIGGTFEFPTGHLLTFSTQLDDIPAANAANPYSTAAVDQQESERHFAARYQASTARLSERLLTRAGVLSATYSSKLPNDDQLTTAIEVEGVARFTNGDSAQTRVEYAVVGPTFFETLGMPISSGRAFSAADTVSGRNTAIVDARFVHRVLGGRNPIGVRYRRVRYASDRTSKPEFAEWRQIVGVVPELSPITYESAKNGVVYEARSIAAAYPAFSIVRVTDDPRRHITEARQLAADIDASLRLNSVRAFDDTGSEERLLFSSMLKVVGIIGLIALMLSTAGIHALMAFTVALRTREIGIRTALGAQHSDVVRGTFARAFLQVGSGVVAGLIPGTLFLVFGPPEINGMGWISGSITAATILVFVLLVAGFACALPVRRALRVQPTEALRST